MMESTNKGKSTSSVRNDEERSGGSDGCLASSRSLAGDGQTIDCTAGSTEVTATAKTVGSNRGLDIGTTGLQKDSILDKTFRTDKKADPAPSQANEEMDFEMERGRKRKTRTLTDEDDSDTASTWTTTTNVKEVQVYLGDTPASVGSQLLEWLDDLEEMRGKSKNLQWKLSGRMRRTIEKLKEGVMILTKQCVAIQGGSIDEKRDAEMGELRAILENLQQKNKGLVTSMERQKEANKKLV
ncbi:hypothetical protein X777_09445 [Ooceraea biroi]|uniref:Uncharacterized protein n=1 Tax=Ooceraea biroi TaxID=2015173 RepID=A0A026W8L9_OOCBI|nr:hypothetical protein X777_09445 [Ooceraea biroi]